jgi:Ion channel
MAASLIVVGAALVVLAIVDSLWTILWVDGHGGPVAGRLTTAMHAAFVRIPRGGTRWWHRLVSLEGPLVMTASLVVWVLLIWVGWATIFSAAPGAVVDGRTGVPASLVARIYFVGYTLCTLGNGEFVPAGGGWQLVTALVSMSGLALITLAVTYLLAVLEAIVGKRTFATQVFGVADSP